VVSGVAAGMVFIGAGAPLEYPWFTY